MRRLALAPALALFFPVLSGTSALSAEDVWLRAVVPERPPAAAPPRTGSSAVQRRRPTPAPPAPGLNAGDSGLVELTRGSRFPDPGAAVAPAEIDRTLLRLGPGRAMPLTGARAEGALTKLDATYAGAGLATLAVQLHPRFVTHEPAAFEELLAQAGAEEALAERRKRKDTKKPGRAVWLETAKAFANVRDPRLPPSPPDADLPLGLPLELTLGTPLPARAGAALTATLVLAGQPAARASVRLLPPSGEPQVATTDEKGTVSFTPGGAGPHLLSAAFVRPLAKADRKKGEVYKKADWETFATSLRLDVGAAAPAPASTPTPKKGKPRPKR